MTEQPAPQLRVADILDGTTLVLAGEGLVQLAEGDLLLVLGVGGIVRGTQTPLVVPKGEVEVTMVAPYYVIARPKAIEVHAEPPLALLSLAEWARSGKLVRRRPSLNVEERALSGNPAATPIRIGDPVVRPHEIKQFILRLAEERTDL